MYLVNKYMQYKTDKAKTHILYMPNSFQRKFSQLKKCVNSCEKFNI